MKKRPVFILTGFLGAGKTTLLNRLLSEPDFAKTAVIINEFGEVGFDHLLAGSSDDAVLELSNGCLCCTIRGELIDTIMSLEGRDFDRLVIETTGLADPVPVAQAIIANADVSERFELAGVVTAIDVIAGVTTLEDQVEAQRQVALASHLVLTKSDLLPRENAAGAKARLIEKLQSINPNARLHDAKKLDGSALSELFRVGGSDMAEVYNQVPADRVHGHTHDHGEHAHDVNFHNQRIRSITLSHDGPIPMEVFERFMTLVTSAHGNSVLRLKGLVSIEGRNDQPLVVDGVQTIFHEPRWLDAWPDSLNSTRMVVIVQDMDPEFIQRLFNGFVDKPAIDTPDRTALMENPLGVSGHKF